MATPVVRNSLHTKARLLGVQVTTAGSRLHTQPWCLLQHPWDAHRHLGSLSRASLPGNWILTFRDFPFLPEPEELDFVWLTVFRAFLGTGASLYYLWLSPPFR